MKDNPHTEETIESWFNNESNYQPKGGYDSSLHDARKADKEIKYCPECNKCWQIDWETSRSNYHRENNIVLCNYYGDFPKYGKEEKICDCCNKLKQKGER